MWRKFLLWGGLLVGILFLLTGGTAVAHMVNEAVYNGEVARNVSVAGVDVSGLGKEDLWAALDEIEAEWGRIPATVAAADFEITTDMAELGVKIDRVAVTEAALAVGRNDGFVDDFRSWLRSFFGKTRYVPLMFELDDAATIAYIDNHEEALRVSPIEPTFTGASGTIVVTEGLDGARIDGAVVAEALEPVVESGLPPYNVAVDLVPVPPLTDDAKLAAAVAHGEDLASDPIVVRVNGRNATLYPETIERWVVSDWQDGQLTAVFDLDLVQRSVEGLLADYDDPGTKPRFTVVDNEVSYTLGAPPKECCGEGVGELLYEAALEGKGGLVRLPSRLTYDDGGRAQVEALGVNELIAEFTTRHNCCESRVTNIHRIADIVRGYMIEPGGRFSINDYVGRRTRDKGFVSAGVIESGHFTEDVGGGISQFATTLFNAAFFAGMDFETYQSHSIYISRYPYGREATMSYPAPDLAILNNSPYGMLLWTEYTGNSITVQVYSTPYFEVEQTGQSTRRSGFCRHVNTFRSRTTPDGEVLKDSVFASYRPREGVDCNGNEIPKPP
jgi:hypothetical protein